jgi:hypothetical protein
LHATGYTDATGISYAFQSRGYIHSVPKDVTTVGNDVALVNTNSEINSSVIRRLGITLSHALLDFVAHRTASRTLINSAKKTIACVFDDASAMLPDFRFNQFMTMGL